MKHFRINQRGDYLSSDKDVKKEWWLEDDNNYYDE